MGFLPNYPAILARLIPLAIAGLGLWAGGVAAEPRQDPESALSHDEFWSQALASRPSLDVQRVGGLNFHGVQIERLLYSGSTWQGKSQRVYAIYAHPEGKGPFPAILQIHGGGQTCYPANIAYFVQRGYACLAFDWTGPRPGRADDAVTHWAAGITGNFFGGDGEDPRHLIVYHAALSAISGIDFLVSRPEVDGNRIGIEGVSWGGFLCWLVNGLDARVKVAVPVYGIGNLDQQWNQMGQALALSTATWRDIYDRLLDASSFTATQHGPILFASGADDFFGPQDLAEARLAQLSVDHRRS
jgi:cephalosporin-C deacetylase-like acetyl esterase